jgi:hypothetical protein
LNSSRSASGSKSHADRSAVENGAVLIMVSAI